MLRELDLAQNGPHIIITENTGYEHQRGRHLIGSKVAKTTLIPLMLSTEAQTSDGWAK